MLSSVQASFKAGWLYRIIAGVLWMGVTGMAEAATPANSMAATSAKPPSAKVVEKIFHDHGIERVDPYYWLGNRKDPAVVDYLKKENAYTEAVMAPTRELQTKLFEEMKARMPPRDESVPAQIGDYFYYRRFDPGKEYRVFCRKKTGADAMEEVILDVNVLARGQKFFDVPGARVSPDHTKVAFAADRVGRRFYDIRVKDLRTGKLLPDLIKDTTGNFAWAADSRTIFFVRQDKKTLRPDTVFRVRLGKKGQERVFFEKDEAFLVTVTAQRTRDSIMISSSATDSTEYQILDAHKPDLPPKLFQARRANVLYDVEDGGDRYFILTNDTAKNFRVMTSPKDNTEHHNWVELLAHDPARYVNMIAVFSEFWVYQSMVDGLAQLVAIPRTVDGQANDAAQNAQTIAFPDPVYDAGMSDDNPEFRTAHFRYTYESLAVPLSYYDYDPNEKTSTLRKRLAVGNDFDPSRYQAERLMVTAADGARIPVSIVYRKGYVPDGSRPLLLHAYGSYGVIETDSFSISRISLLDRGFAFANAHVRGGSEMGRSWYEDGRLLKKENTFSDFIAVAEDLVKRKFTSKEHLYIQGGSAGGLLVGAVLNKRSELFHGAIANVPFVDVVTTMLDTSIPLTTGEFTEWGDPREKAYFDYMLAYSPYDNVRAQSYPNILVTAGLHDSQVQYWEPAKWVARLRSRKTDSNTLLLRTDMSAGHGGKTGRFRQYEDAAFRVAFLLRLEDIRE